MKAGSRECFVWLLILFLGPYAVGEQRRFTVRDAVEMATFIDPYPSKQLWPPNDEFKFSIDHQHVAVVTQSNLLKTDESESTLWVFDVKSIELFSRKTDAIAPQPRAVTRMRSVSASDGDGAPAITSLRWLPDGKIGFLGREKQPCQSLYIVNPKTGVRNKVTPDGQCVTQFDIVKSTVVYTVTRSNETGAELRGAHGEPAAVVGTGRDFFSLLFPDKTEGRIADKISELWMIRGSKTTAVLDSNTKLPVHIPTPVHGDTLSLSPSGHSVVVTQHPWRIPKGWESYEPFPSSLGNSIRFKPTAAGIQKDNNALAAEEFALINLDTGEVRTLLDAPIGRSLLYYTPQSAVWSRDGRRLLLVNTFLPLEGVSDSERRLRAQRPCVALLNLNSGEVTCVAPVNRSPEDTQNLQKGSNFYCLMNIRWNADEQVVVLRYYGLSNSDEKFSHPPEVYRYDRGSWRFTEPSAADPAVLKALEHLKAETPLSLSINEDLNSPEKLCVTDNDSGQEKELWDPNPYLKTIDLGEASIYRWKDSSGREWVGGLVKPPDYEPGQRYPLVIQTHGFARHRFISVGTYTSANAARPMAARGMMVLQVPDSHEGFLTAKEPLVHLQGFQGAIDQLAVDGLIDPQRVGIIGFSRTCFYVLVALEKAPERFAAATIADGMMFGYMQYLLNVDNPAGGEQFKKQVRDIIGDQPFGDGLRAWLRESPGFNLDRVAAPLRVEAYGRLSLAFNWDAYAALRMQGKPVDLIFFPNAPHVLERPRERLASEQGNVDWFAFWLLGDTDTEPLKADQYARWRMLRDHARQRPNSYHGQGPPPAP